MQGLTPDMVMEVGDLFIYLNPDDIDNQRLFLVNDFSRGHMWYSELEGEQRPSVAMRFNQVPGPSEREVLINLRGRPVSMERLRETVGLLRDGYNSGCDIAHVTNFLVWEYHINSEGFRATPKRDSDIAVYDRLSDSHLCEYIRYEFSPEGISARLHKFHNPILVSLAGEGNTGGFYPGHGTYHITPDGAGNVDHALQELGISTNIAEICKEKRRFDNLFWGNFARLNGQFTDPSKRVRIYKDIPEARADYLRKIDEITSALNTKIVK